MTNKRELKGTSVRCIDPLILDGKAFKIIYKRGPKYRSKLYRKVNSYLSPPKNSVTIKKWYLYPETMIPKRQGEHIEHIMLHSLSESLSDIRHEMDELMQECLVLIPEINALLDNHEQERK